MTLSAPLKLDSLVQIGQWVDTCSEQWSIPAAKNFALQLCCEEAFSNVVKHGVQGDSAQESTAGFATFSLEHLGNQLHLTVEDSCEPFNPLDAAQPLVPSSLAEAKIGGLGIDLMKKFAQKILYERKNYRNRLSFFFELPSLTQVPLVTAPQQS